MDRARRRWVPLVFVGLAGLAVCPPELAAGGQTRPAPDTYHWVLPVDQAGVEVATLHPNDCYVVQDAAGVAYFGRPSAALLELQRQLVGATAHRVEVVSGHAECRLDACLEIERLAAAIEREIAAAGRARYTRGVDHQPSPLDHFYGGAYTDVGSDDRETYRNAPEQRMLFRHLATAGRENCYEAKLPRTLTIHVRDHETHPDRTGVYRGYVFIEHHHPEIAGATIAE